MGTFTFLPLLFPSLAMSASPPRALSRFREDWHVWQPQPPRVDFFVRQRETLTESATSVELPTMRREYEA
jgi:hypothetical protein